MINNIVSQNNVSSRVNLETKVDPRVVKSGQQVTPVSSQQSQQQQLPAGLKVGVSEQNDVFAHQHNIALNAFKNFGKDGTITPFNPETDMDILAEYEKLREAANATLRELPALPVQNQGNTSQNTATAKTAVQETSESTPVSDMSGSFNPPQYTGAYNLPFSNTGINTFNNAPVYNTASNALNAAIAQGYQPVISSANSQESSSSLPPAALEALAQRSRPYVEANTNSDKSGLTPVAVRTPSTITNPVAQNSANSETGAVQTTAETAAVPTTSTSPMTEQSGTQQTQEAQTQSEQTGNTEQKKPNGESFTEEELAEIEDLKARDEEVRVHENAHKTAGGQYAGSPSYTYTTGPDGKRYITDGEVSIDVGEESDPQDTIDKMQQVKRAALAPAQPSGQDRSVYTQASQIEAQARQELNEQNREEAQSMSQSSSTSSTQETKPAVQEDKPVVQNTEDKPVVQNTRNADQQNTPANNQNAPAVQSAAQNDAPTTNQAVPAQDNTDSASQQNKNGLVPSSANTPTPNTPKASDTATFSVNNNAAEDTNNSVENETRTPASSQMKSLSANEEEVGPDI